MSLSVLSDTLQLFLMKFQVRTVPSSLSRTLVLKPLPQTPLPSNVNCTESAVVVHWGRGRRQECRYQIYTESVQALLRQALEQCFDLYLGLILVS